MGHSTVAFTPSPPSPVARPGTASGHRAGFVQRCFIQVWGILKRQKGEFPGGPRGKAWVTFLRARKGPEQGPFMQTPQKQLLLNTPTPSKKELPGRFRATLGPQPSAGPEGLCAGTGLAALLCGGQPHLLPWREALHTAAHPASGKRALACAQWWAGREAVPAEGSGAPPLCPAGFPAKTPSAPL